MASNDTPRMSNHMPRVSNHMPRVSNHMPRVSNDKPNVCNDMLSASYNTSSVSDDTPFMSNDATRLPNDALNVSHDVPNVSHHVPNVLDEQPNVCSTPRGSHIPPQAFSCDADPSTTPCSGSWDETEHEIKALVRDAVWMEATQEDSAQRNVEIMRRLEAAERIEARRQEATGLGVERTSEEVKKGAKRYVEELRKRENATVRVELARRAGSLHQYEVRPPEDCYLPGVLGAFVGLDGRCHLRKVEVTRVNPEGFPCTACREKFEDSLSLRDHYIRMHSGRRYYDCPHCHRAFYEKDEMEVHVLDHANLKMYTQPPRETASTTKPVHKTPELDKTHASALDCSSDTTDCDTKLPSTSGSSATCSGNPFQMMMENLRRGMEAATQRAAAGADRSIDRDDCSDDRCADHDVDRSADGAHSNSTAQHGIENIDIPEDGDLSEPPTAEVIRAKRARFLEGLERGRGTAGAPTATERESSTTTQRGVPASSPQHTPSLEQPTAVSSMTLSAEQQVIAAHLTPMFPDLSQDVICQAVRHPANYHHATEVWITTCTQHLLELGSSTKGDHLSRFHAVSKWNEKHNEVQCDVLADPSKMNNDDVTTDMMISGADKDDVTNETIPSSVDECLNKSMNEANGGDLEDLDMKEVKKKKVPTATLR